MKIFKKLKTQEGHQAVIKKEETPKLLTPCRFHISIFSKEPTRKKYVIHNYSCAFDNLAIKYVEAFREANILPVK